MNAFELTTWQYFANLLSKCVRFEWFDKVVNTPARMASSTRRVSDSVVMMIIATSEPCHVDTVILKRYIQRLSNRSSHPTHAMVG